MTLKNTSRYPIETVRELVRFAARQIPGLDLKGLHINVKNSAYAYRGRAYSSVPRISNAPKGSTCLVVVCVGIPTRFPCNNMTSTSKWKRLSEGEQYNGVDVRSCVKNGKSWLEKKVKETHPYGGKKSPLIVFKDWKEAVVGIAAHELTHIHQFQNKQPISEVACEKRALKALEAFRISIHIPYDTLAG